MFTELRFCIAEKAVNGEDDTMRSPAKSDTLRSTDSASGGETLEERSSKEVKFVLVFLTVIVEDITLCHTIFKTGLNSKHYYHQQNYIWH